jgi:two-component system sensor histidine kinase BaeS
MRARRVPLRRSLVVKLMATSILVAMCAIVATAWLAVQSTTKAIQQEQGRSLTEDKGVYDKLLGYAATHSDWSEVDPMVTELAGAQGRRITLMSRDRQTIIDSSSGPSLLQARPSAEIDPLNVDVALTGGTQRIDPRAVGPYALPKAEADLLRRQATEAIACINQWGITAEAVTQPGGRTTVAMPDDPRAAASLDDCAADELRNGTRSEVANLSKLARLTGECLYPAQSDRTFGFKIVVSLDFSVQDYGHQIDRVQSGSGESTADHSRRANGCVQRIRKSQLKGYVAPPALLFVTDPADDVAQPAFNLSRSNAIRIASVTGAVLVLAIAITVLVGMRLVRPLRVLTEAARRPVEDQNRVPVTTHDEIGYLATALNDLSERRERTELQRKAMVSDVAHELRTPLTNIRSWLEAAQDGLAPVDPQLITLLLEEAVQLQHIIDDLRDLAAADAGSLRLHPEVIFVNDALEQVAEAHRGAAETAGVRLSIDKASDPQIMVDPVRLRQLVGNLVSNAVRHTPQGGEVTIRSRVDGGRLVVDVVDTGSGIAPADLQKVFDRFWRADGSRSRATGGSGLGLAIVRKLVEAHGGDVTVANRPGRGAIFTVRLPA